MTQIDLDMEELYELYHNQTHLGQSPAFNVSMDQLHALLPKRLSRLLALATAYDGAVSVAVRLIGSIPPEADAPRYSISLEHPMDSPWTAEPNRNGIPNLEAMKHAWSVFASTIGLWLPPQLAKVRPALPGTHAGPPA